MNGYLDGTLDYEKEGKNYHQQYKMCLFNCNDLL